LREDNLQLVEAIELQRHEIESLEKQLVNAKLEWANLDMENDELILEIKKKSHKIELYGEKLARMELDLVQARQ